MSIKKYLYAAGAALLAILAVLLRRKDGQIKSLETAMRFKEANHKAKQLKARVNQKAREIEDLERKRREAVKKVKGYKSLLQVVVICVSLASAGPAYAEAGDTCIEALTMTELSLKAHKDALKEERELSLLYKEQRDDAQKQAVEAAKGSSFLGVPTDVVIGVLIGGLAGVLVTR